MHIRVDSSKFVSTYLRVHAQGGGIEQVADALGMNKQSATVRASQLRSAGVPLPKLANARKKLDIAALAKMVEDYHTDMSENDNSDDPDEDVDNDGQYEDI